jgi:hypothetical protein
VKRVKDLSLCVLTEGGRMGSKWTLGILAGGGGVDWIHLAQDRDRCRAVVNAAMNLRVVAPRS